MEERERRDCGSGGVSAARRNRVKWSAEESSRAGLGEAAPSTDVDSVGLTFDQKFDGNSVKGNG